MSTAIDSMEITQWSAAMIIDQIAMDVLVDQSDSIATVNRYTVLPPLTVGPRRREDVTEAQNPVA